MKNKIIKHKNYIDIIIYDKLGIYVGTTKIDNNDFIKAIAYNWYWSFRSNGNRGYIRSGTNHISLHQLIMGKKSGYEIDHINRDVLDNRRKNLRFVTHSQNIINAKIQSNNKSGYKGVSWAKHMNKWRAQIKDNKKTKHLGYFLNIKNAIKARKIGEQKYYFCIQS